jgi:hypothetical protein
MTRIRKDSWCREEKDLLLQVYCNNTKKAILSAFENRGRKRSWLSIRLNAKKLGLNRNPQIIMQEMTDGGNNIPDREDTWSESENTTLKNVYENNQRKIIMEALPGRTWRAIREHAQILNLKRSIENINLDRNEKNRITRGL